jgi:hypothetical protein
MPLLEGLNASGEPPAQQFKASVFFRQHPKLADEVRACRAAGYSWRQIATQIHTEHQVRISPSSLSDFIEGRS